MKKPTEIIGFIQTLDCDKAAQAWCDLNCRKWPTCFPEEYKPHWWGKKHDTLTDRDIAQRQQAVSILLMDYLATRTTSIDTYWLALNATPHV